MQQTDRAAGRPQKIRAPRVQMTYDVQVGDGIHARELPFVVGVLGDFTGDSQADKRRLKERAFVTVTLDNFDEVLRALAPRVLCQVENLIGDPASRLTVDLSFKSMADFRPESVLAQIAPLHKLLQARERLAALRGTLTQVKP